MSHLTLYRNYLMPAAAYVLMVVVALGMPTMRME
jgi:hypothetical protein